MPKKTRLWTLMIFSLALALFYFWQDTAEAARMGGGRSFGSRPSYQRSAPAPSPNTTTSTGQTARQQPAGAASGPFAGRGGMLGGLLMGGLIGSLLFGGGFSGPGMMDLLLVGGGIFLLMRFLRARRMAAESASGAGAPAYGRGSSQAFGSTGYAPDTESAPETQPPPLPPGFDAQEFLKGANAIYVRLQAAWDRRDLEDIRQFASEEVFTEIYHQAQEDPNPGKTELLLINPSILEVRDVEDRTVASVLYDVMLRENEAEVSKQVRELWHFSRERGNADSFWLLEGIQQVQ